jgi:AcrR family transcriptional regulator
MPSSKPAKKQTRWRRRKEARPTELIAAALELFVERGYSATRLDDVARSAGVSKGTVYLYFENKEALFRAVVQEMVLPELARVENLVKSFTGSTEELLRRLMHDWWSRVGETQLCGIPKLMISEAGNFPEVARFFVEQAVHRARRLFAQILERGIASGEFHSLDVRYAVRVLVAPMVFAAIWQRSLLPYDSEEYDVHRYLDTHLDSFLNGVRASPRTT